MSRARILSVLVVLGVLVTGALVAHFRGILNPFYHRLGWHGLMVSAGQESGANAVDSKHGDNANHSGMSMPGMDMPGMKMPEDSKPAAGGELSKISGYSTVTLAPERQQLIGVRIGEVKRDKLLMSIRAVGIIEPDQRRLTRIQTRINGWVTKLYVDFVGQRVQKGEPLLEIYSPELLASQEGYLIARRGPETGMSNPSRQRLVLMGVAPEELAELERTGKTRDTLVLRSPIEGRILERNVYEGSYIEPATELYKVADLSVVWVQAKIYEFELPHIEIGQPVDVTIQSEPNQPFQGKVTFVEPVVQEATRTVKVRVAIDNPKEQLKPGMYADLKIEHDMGEGLLVPDSAVMRTGERAICFRSLPEGRFEPVEVKLGGHFEDRFEIVSGLKEGDKIVVSAGFLIDSESRLKATTSGAAGGHKHGG